ncbi:MAG: tRNA (guanosine(46)-N7)-methyltransferase TrmB [Thermobacillus sp.]|jgi:tRNA (guanine-N7-)-methyltransferase|uniref:tRNA (guanine-N(7)-)-methyltransferase n=1 Tax=Thermobacillus composti (strain DSM 18247 / JCM 13945 / KWC4) TaxID=717605 RepID=L0EBL2_THECK|nr:MULTISPECIES: tRNA (guanosine(46)-N7)-methyltransferase TrmB [Thermobacillus]AGA57187.1 tRNA (guanine-N(7)-)-methyltransferase [Thermobacillus composti KWC4]REK56147.1 MAG: tRNA (guanosine(46)-N7)-methyltransferase TrmB [Thermobacillus sp.]
MRLRGRKGIREEIESQPELVVLDPAPYRGRWHERFGNDRPIHVELGMGKGKFISEMSVRNPEINYIGIDMFDELIRRASLKARAAWEPQGAETPPNLALVRANIEYLETFFAPGEVERIYLNFSDPWPKKKHAKRRLTHPRFLRKYLEILNENGEIHFKTDSRLLFEFSLNSFCDMEIPLRNISLDLHRDGLREDLVLTEYETKFAEQGMPIYRLEAVVGEAALRRHREAKEAGLSRIRTSRPASSQPM